MAVSEFVSWSKVAPKSQGQGVVAPCCTYKSKGDSFEQLMEDRIQNSSHKAFNPQPMSLHSMPLHS